MLKQRVITALVLSAVLLAFLFAPAVVSLLFFTAVVTIAAWEWAGLAAMTGNSRLVYALAVAILIGLAWTLLTKQRPIRCFGRAPVCSVGAVPAGQ